MSVSTASVLHEGWLRLLEQTFTDTPTSNGVPPAVPTTTPRRVWVRLFIEPAVAIGEYDNADSPSPLSLLYPTAHWAFAHNPLSSSFLMKSSYHSAVYQTETEDAHRLWRAAIGRLQEKINSNAAAGKLPVSSTAPANKARSDEEIVVNGKANGQSRQQPYSYQYDGITYTTTQPPPQTTQTPPTTPSAVKPIASRVSSLSSARLFQPVANMIRAFPSVTSSLMAPSPPSSPLLPHPRATSPQPLVLHARNNQPRTEESKVKPAPVAHDSDSDDDDDSATVRHSPLKDGSAPTASVRPRSQSMDAAFRPEIDNAAASTLAPPFSSSDDAHTPTPPLSTSSSSSAVTVSDDRPSGESSYLATVKNRMFQKMFNLPATEELLCDYSCAVQRSILLHGRMYISEHYVCFFSSIFSHKTMIVLPVADIIAVQAAKVALVFDNSIKVFVQSGALPIPVPAPVQQLTAHSISLTRLNSAKHAHSSSLSQIITPDEVESKTESSPESPPPIPQSASAPSFAEFNAAISAAIAQPNLTNGTLTTPQPQPQPQQPLPQSQPQPQLVTTVSMSEDDTEELAFVLSTDTTTDSSLLSSTQIDYLISIGHPNIAVHFFASFLTRDHALSLMDTLIQKRRMPERQAAAAATTAAVVVAADKKLSQIRRGEQSANPTTQLPTTTPPLTPPPPPPPPPLVPPPPPPPPPLHTTQSSTPPLPLSSSSSPLAAATTPPTTSATFESSLIVPAPAAPRSSSSPPEIATSAAQTAVVPAIDFGESDEPPLGEFNDAEDYTLLDTTIQTDAATLFDSFLDDNARFPYGQFYRARPSDADFKITKWNTNTATDTTIHGNATRRIYYKMTYSTPIGPPVTRVHRIQRLYRTANTQSAFRIDTVSVTPDVMFGECMYLVERMRVTDIDKKQCRLHITGAVRFRSRPWRMRAFIGLITSVSRDGAAKTCAEWKSFILSKLATVNGTRANGAPLQTKPTIDEIATHKTEMASATTSAHIKPPTDQPLQTSTLSPPPPPTTTAVASLLGVNLFSMESSTAMVSAAAAVLFVCLIVSIVLVSSGVTDGAVMLVALLSIGLSVFICIDGKREINQIQQKLDRIERAMTVAETKKAN